MEDATGDFVSTGLGRCIAERELDDAIREHKLESLRAVPNSNGLSCATEAIAWQTSCAHR